MIPPQWDILHEIARSSDETPPDFSDAAEAAIEEIEVLREQLKVAVERAAEHHRLTEAFTRFISFAMTCRKVNTSEWMKLAAERINEAIAATGSDDRVEWPGRWASEFTLVSGGKGDGGR